MDSKMSHFKVEDGRHALVGAGGRPAGKPLQFEYEPYPMRELLRISLRLLTCSLDERTIDEAASLSTDAFSTNYSPLNRG
jgi:hypothetical protein